MFAILCMTRLTLGEQPWTEVGGGVDSGKMLGSGTFITVKSTPSEEVSFWLAPFHFCLVWHMGS